MGKTIITGILVKNLEGKVLLVKKAVGPHAEKYLLPGGELAAGELADDAVQQVLFVQTGIRATNIRRVLFDDELIEIGNEEKKHYIFLLYTGEYVSGELKTAENGEDIKWLAPEELNQLSLSAPLQKLLAVIGKWKNKFVFNFGLYVPDKI